MERLTTRCCIAGGGPAGVMLGYLLARSGVDVMVLEKHADFLRDFRGDTIHPSTLEILHELGLLGDFLKRPHQELGQVAAEIGRQQVILGDLSHLPTHCKFIAFMPQWDFLNFMAASAERFPTFRLMMNTEATNLIEENGQIRGVRATNPQGELEIRADLVVAADGRHSTLREKSGLEVMKLAAPMDVLWLHISRRPSDPPQSFGRVDAGRFFISIERGDYWQCAYIIPKGALDEIRAAGLDRFRENVGAIAPYTRDRLSELKSWDDVKLLSVAVDRLRRWYRPGLLCIGDAAHAMSPVGGVGINLAIQDAVATANILSAPLSNGAVSVRDLQKLQNRRMFPTRATQRLQVFIQNRVIRRVLQGSSEIRGLPWPMKLLDRWPYLRRFPARIVGIGFRPEHVHASLLRITSHRR